MFRTLQILVLLSVPGFLAGCEGEPCKKLTRHICKCDQSKPVNRKNCASAISKKNFLKAKTEALKKNLSIEDKCREALRNFRCP